MWRTSSAGRTASNWGNASTELRRTKFRAGFAFLSTTVIDLDDFPSDVEARLDWQLPGSRGRQGRDQGRDHGSAGPDLQGQPGPRPRDGRREDDGPRWLRFDPSGNGINDVQVRVYQTAPSAALRCSARRTRPTPPAADGFFFVWKTGANDGVGAFTGTNNPAVRATSTTSPSARAPVPARPCRSTCSTGRPGNSQNNLGNKEFDVEDFYVSGPTKLKFESQPTR